MKAFFDTFIRRQGELLLNRSRYAYILIFLFAGVPLMSWLSVAIMSFITLRKGCEDGLKALGIGLLGLLASTLMTFSLNLSNLMIVLFTFVPCFLCAWHLRVYARWDWMVFCLVGVVSCLIGFFYFNPPRLLLEEYQTLEAMMLKLQSGGLKLSSILASKQHMIAYLLGIQALTLFVSTLFTLMIARALQAKLFYPTGFMQEMLSFQVLPVALLPFILVVSDLLYWRQPLAIALSPIWVCYTASAGVSILICLFSSHRALIMLFLLLIAAALVPAVMLPILVSMGVLDGLLHFRARYANPNSDFKNS